MNLQDNDKLFNMRTRGLGMQFKAHAANLLVTLVQSDPSLGGQHPL